MSINDVNILSDSIISILNIFQNKTNCNKFNKNIITICNKQIISTFIPNYDGMYGNEKEDLKVK